MPRSGAGSVASFPPNTKRNNEVVTRQLAAFRRLVAPRSVCQLSVSVMKWPEVVWRDEERAVGRLPGVRCQPSVGEPGRKRNAELSYVR